MDNNFIADQFSMLSKLMDINGENSFKSKNYSIAAFNIEKLPIQLTTLETNKIAALKGIGESTAKKIIEIIQTGKLAALEEILENTPPGVTEMLNIKGIGPKKINTIWKEMELESLGELLYACQENRLMLYKGFGEKTQQNVKDSIEFYFKNQGSFLYAETESYAENILKVLKTSFPDELTSITGEFKRQNEIIQQLDWITTINQNNLIDFLKLQAINQTETSNESLGFIGNEQIPMNFLIVDKQHFETTLFETSCSKSFISEWKNKYKVLNCQSDETQFSQNNLNYIPAFLRENPLIIEKAKSISFDGLIQQSDIKAIIHSHSNWSDGNNTLEEMAMACKAKGFEYLVISDHSKSAFYANGLQENRILEQHKQINELNFKLAPFKIFKSIECDILNDGQLDYDDEVLSSFDLVIASIHSNLKMNEEKAMARLLKAIENPFTTILGHPTGRLLLSRKEYPVNFNEIIAASKQHHVAIELNAHPRRLDISWQHLPKMMESGVMTSINPDAHAIKGFDDIKYGVLSAQKGQLTPQFNLSSFSLLDFEEYLKKMKQIKFN